MKHNYFKSNQCEEMARNLWVYLYTQMGVKSAKSMSAGSEAEGRKTEGRASNEHPLSIHSASIEHPLQGRGKAVKMPLHFLRYAAMIFAVLVMSVGQAWGTDITVAPGTWFNENKTTFPYGLVTISHSSTASKSQISSNAITTGSNADVITINFATTKSDMYIKTITFNSLSNGTLSSSDGTISDGVFTASGNKNSVNIVLTSNSGAKGSVKVTNVVINTGDNVVEKITFSSVSDGNISFTSSAGTSALTSITSNGSPSVSSTILSWPNSKTLVFTSANNILYAAFLVNDGKSYTSGFSASPDTYSNCSWSGSSKTVTFTNGTGGGKYIKEAYVIVETPSCTSITPTWSTDYSSTTLNVGGTSSTPAVGKDGSSGALSFSSGDTYIATVNSSGVVTGVATGTVTITATVAEDETNGKCEGTVTKEFTIKAGITYNANGADDGSVPTDASTYAYNANITVKGNTGSLVKDGKIFNGWNTRSDGTGTHYEAGATMKMPSKSTGVTLYAEWVGYATSWEWWNCGQSNNSTTFTYITSKNYICSFASSASTAVASWDIEGGEYYRGIKIKTKDHSIAFWVQTGKRVSITFGTRPTKPTFTVGGVDKSSDVGASENADSITVTYTTTGDTKFYIENETATKTAFTVKSVKIEDDATCPDAYSFHYGPATGAWETPICFEQVGSTHEWNITNFTIPDHTNGQFWVGYAGSTNDQSATKAWTDGLSDLGGGTMNGAMVLLPTNGSVVGPATGATGTLVIWDNSSSKNQYVGFRPDGYSIKYSSTNHPFTETATANVWETELLTLPSVSTTYTMEIKTADGYTTCYHSKAAEALSSPGNTMRKNGKKMLYLVPGVWRTGDNNEHMAVWDATNSEWGNGGEFLTWNSSTNKYEGYVSGSAETIVFVRIDVNESSPTWTTGKWHNKTSDITLNLIDNQFSITGWGSSTSTYTQAPYSHPATGDNGKFRMYDNSNDLNWYAHWIPYYKLSYDGNGGTGSVAAQYRNSELSTSPLSVAGNGFTREGWTFTGWNTEKHGKGIAYSPGANIDITGNTTLYAQWKKTVYFKVGAGWDGSSAWYAIYCFDSENDSDPYRDWVRMNTAASSCETDVFKGDLPGNGYDKLIVCRMDGSKDALAWDSKWNQTGNISYDELDDNDQFTPTSLNGDDCTGSWGTYSIPTYTISYDKGYTTYTGGNTISGSKDDESKTCAIDFSLPSSAIFTTTGYTQTGWATENGGSKAYELGGDYTTNAAQTFYPVWTANNYDLTWNLGGGTTTSAGTGISSGVSSNTTSSVAYGTTVTAPSVAKTGYTFSAWSPTVVSPMPDADATYTATWSSTTPTISSQPSDVNCNVGDERSISVTASISTGGTPTYQWQVSDNGSDWANVASSGTSASYTVPTASAGTKYYRCVVTNPNGSATTTSSIATVTVTAVVGTTYYLVTSTAQLNSSDTYVIMDDGKNAMMGVYGTNAMTAITSGFTAATDKSTVTVSSSDVNTLKLQAESSAWNIVGKDDNKLTTNTKIGENLYGNTSKATEDSKDNFVFSFADGKVTIKRDAETDFHIYYSSGTGFNQSETATNIRLYTSNSTPVYTVTYNLNGGEGTLPTNRPEKSGTSITLASSTGLTKEGFTFDGWFCSANSTKYAAGASYTMTAVNTTFTAQWVAVSGYTVTYNYNGATSGASPTSATGASVTLPNPTRTGYELDGWYTTAGEKVEDGGETYNPTADITLYARWQVVCDGSGTDSSVDDVAATGYTTYQEKGGSNVVFTSAPSIGFKYKDADGNTINNSTTAVVRNNAYKCQISSDSGNKGSIKTNSTFSNVDSISFYFAASDKGGCKIAVWCSTDDFSADSTQLLSATNYADNNGEFKLKTLAIPSGQKASALRFKFRFTVTSSGKTSYIDSLKIYSSTASSGTCYHVYYYGNGAESGFVSDTTSYADGAKATVLSYNDSRYPLTKEGYDFQGWATSAGGSAAYSDGEKITIDGEDVHLYAKWATASSALVTWKMKTADNEAWATTTGTGTTDGTNISSIGTSHDEGNNKADNSATAKTAMASGEVSSTAAPDKSARFTFTIGATKQVEISKFDCKVFNVGSGNRTYKAQISDAAGNVYNSTNTVPVTASATLTDASFVFGSGKILRGAVTIRIYAWKTSDSPTDFRMGPDVKFYGTVDDYACATPSAPTISGASEYAVGQTITLTASHDGENYDNLTTYTWYRGANWATASAASPVQDADTGEDGYTLTKTAVAADDDLFWCKVSNGTCEAHNTTGYNVNVYAANTITWHLNDGEWGEVEHKDSYSRFDDDYTLPVPSKDGYVFAGWYEASDFSGLPISTLESGSVGDREYWAKWGSAVTATWTITKVDDALYRGGGGYSVTAVINQADWDDYGDKDDLVLTATEGVTLKNVVKSINGEGKAQVFANFDITTGLEADATEITFTLDVPANGTYAPAELSHDEDLTDCGGGASGYTEFFSMIPKANTCSITNTEANSAPNHFTTCECTSSATITAGGSVTYGLYSSGTGTTSKYWEYNGKNGGWKHSIANSWVVLYSTDQFKAGDSIVITNGNSSSSGYYTIVASASNNTADYHSVSQVAAPSTTSPAKNTNYYYKLPASFVSSNYLVIRSSTSSACYVGTIKAYHAGAKGGVTPTLSWTPALASDGDWDSENNRLNKETGDVDFTFVAGQDKNSLGAITYSSNNPSVATVNAAGTVHIVGAAGDATITATLAASGCFGEATATYNIQVVDNCIDEPGTISTTDLGCSGIEMTVSGHTTSGETVSYQWYKVGTPDETVGTNSTTFTTTKAGEYYVVVTNTGTDHCSMASTNTVKVASKAAATATKIVDSWYVKNGRRTPDVALVQTAGATGFIVKSGETIIWESAGSTKTGFGGCGFHMGTDGIIYLNGTKDDGDATTGLTAGDVTLKITANDGCGSSASELSITIHCQEATTYKEIAFVVDGDKGKDFDQVTSGHADGTELYEYLDSVGTAAGKRLFRLTEQNIYSTTDEKAIRQHYSQYDAILITDDPSTNKVPNKEDYKTGGYVNAFGTMIDVRPILTMEAYVSALKNWGSKGIAGNPQSPNPRQYEMRLECKDHEIYGTGLPDPEDGTNVWEEVIDGETFRHVIVVDSTLGIYNGVAYNVETAGDKKPALQGFTGEAAGSLLGLGRILEGTLQAAIERQEEPAARLLVFGINAKALHETCALTDEGKTVIKNILVYLLKTNMEEVDDCSNYFTGKINNDWSNAGNWSKSALPSTEAKVRILAPCVVSGSHPHVAQVAIVSSGKSSIRETATGSPNCNGSLTINANGALIVEGEVLAAEAPHFAANDLKPTTVNDLIINTNEYNQAALIFDNEEAKTKATVNLYSLGRNDGSYKYQYFAIPMEYVSVSPAFANETHGGTGIYTYVYSEATSGWTRRKYYDDLFAFEGLGITTKSTGGLTYTMTGNLASTATKEITLTHDGTGLNLIGNSWMAPIQIAALAEDNTDTNITKTAYIYCAGRDAVKGAATSGETETAGQWIAIPFSAAEFETWKAAGKLSVIPAMQAFQIKVADEATLTLDYKKVVRGSTNDLNAKLRAPVRRATADVVTMTNIRVADSKTHTDLSLFEGDRFSEAFDNGWEAEYMNGDGRSAKLYAETEAGQMAVVALDDYEGTVVGFEPGQETEYTFSFMGEDNGYYLNDIKLQNSVRITEGETYTFTYEEGDAANRFYISRTAINAPEVATGMENLDAAAPRVQKIIYNDKLYIIRGGRLYDATGKVVK